MGMNTGSRASSASRKARCAGGSRGSSVSKSVQPLGGLVGASGAPQLQHVAAAAGTAGRRRQRPQRRIGPHEVRRADPPGERGVEEGRQVLRRQPGDALQLPRGGRRRAAPHRVVDAQGRQASSRRCRAPRSRRGRRPAASQSARAAPAPPPRRSPPFPPPHQTSPRQTAPRQTAPTPDGSVTISPRSPRPWPIGRAQRLGQRRRIRPRQRHDGAFRGGVSHGRPHAARRDRPRRRNGRGCNCRDSRSPAAARAATSRGRA